MPVPLAASLAPALTAPDLQAPVIAVATLLAALVFGLIGHSLRKIRSTDTMTAFGWWGAGALAGGAGVWTLHFLALTGLGLPWETLLRGWQMAGSGLASALGVAALLGSARVRSSEGARLVLQGLGLALVWALVQSFSLTSLAEPPLASTAGPAWPLLALAGIATGAWAAMALVFSERTARMGPYGLRLALAAVGFALVSGLTQALTLGSLGFVESPRPSGVLLVSGDALEWACGAGALAVLLGLFGVLIDSRASHRHRALAHSLSEANQRLREQALTDPLTRLPNRLMFEEKLSEALELIDDPAGPGGTLAVMFIDLDGFKPVNDSFGHSAGDAVLREIGARLQGLARQTDVVARVGGDEFLLLADPGHAAGAGHLAQRVLHVLAEPCRLPDGAEVRLSGSVGIVMYPEHGPSQKLLARADAAMYAAKRAGGSGFALFEPGMEHDSRAQLELQHELRGAIERAELALYYQPKIDGRSGQITGVEALVRWDHPTRGTVSPAVFIPVAERFGLIGLLGQWVIDEACRQMRAWQDLGLHMRVSVNLSAHQLRQENLVQRIRRALTEQAVDPALLTIEIIESVLLEDEAVTAFAGLAQLGVTLSIDDFGIGYCNFALLRKLPVTQLKVDRSLFTDIQHSTDALAVVDAIVKMAHALGLRVVAEGVETDAQRQMLLALRCDELQGYLFAKPMTAERLTLWAMGDEGVRMPDFRPSLFATAPQTLQ
ncbi:putative bifunctional diguanylate cyclase/phosphodiesterase [Ideonella sp. YS5]|uniref:putative bifunctional diguanylate cyclase/phosphodiesterase n=1 Tax=Ideonella sp. YS5 TaxID=3453714 RepID=UPI003EEAF893